MWQFHGGGVEWHVTLFTLRIDASPYRTSIRISLRGRKFAWFTIETVEAREVLRLLVDLWLAQGCLVHEVGPE